MLSEDLNTMLSLELSNKSRIPTQLLVLTRASQMSSNKPKVTCNTKVFATAHESVALASFRCGRNAVWVEIFLFSARDAHQPIRGCLGHPRF